MLTQLVRDLMRLGVGLEVKDGSAAFTLPRGEPRRSSAEAAVRRSLPEIADHRAEFLAVWQAEAVGEADPERCGECRAFVFDATSARDHPWAFCESLCCPFRNDDWARNVKEWRRRSEWKRKQQGRAGPIPD